MVHSFCSDPQNLIKCCTTNVQMRVLLGAQHSEQEKDALMAATMTMMECDRRTQQSKNTNQPDCPETNSSYQTEQFQRNERISEKEIQDNLCFVSIIILQSNKLWILCYFSHLFITTFSKGFVFCNFYTFQTLDFVCKYFPQQKYPLFFSIVLLKSASVCLVYFCFFLCSF